MLKIIGTLTVFGGFAFLGLGFVFMIAGGSENSLIGAACIGLGLLLFLLTYLMVRAEARRPAHVTHNVQLSGSGEFREKAIQCPACGGSVQDKDIKVVDGGIMVSCPFCGKVSALEEEPKW